MATQDTPTYIPNLGTDLPSSRYLRDNVRLLTFRITNNSNRSEDQGFSLRIMPETYLVDEPQRVTVTQTRGGAFIDNFGRGIGTLTLSGTTGFATARNPNRYGGGRANLPFVDGYLHWVGFREFIDFYLRLKTRADTGDRYELQLQNWLQEDWFVVFPQGLPRLSRSVQQPLLFRYDMTLTLLRRVNLSGYDSEDAHGDELAELSTRVQRAGVIADRMDTILQQLYLTEVLAADPANLALIVNADSATNPSDPAAQELLTTLVSPLTPAQMDTASDAFKVSLLKRNAAATYKFPTDSGVGITARTRALAQNVRDYADGTTSFVNTTLHEAQAVVNGWRDVLDAAEYAINLPGAYARYTKEILCSAQSLLLYPQLFRTTVFGTLRDIASLLEDSGCATTLRI